MSVNYGSKRVVTGAGYGMRDWLAREITGFGAAALVLEPDSLRADVLARLAAQARA